MKKTFFLFAAFIFAGSYSAQILYSNSFGSSALQVYTTSATSTSFANVPASLSVIDDGLKNNTGSLNNPNKPFHEAGLKTTGWALVYNQAENDTFLVSTSWLDTTGIAVNRWIITPPVSNIGANTVLTWLAKSPDASFRDGYEVYGTTNTGVLTPQSFAIGDRLFNIADGSSGLGENSSWTQRSVNIGSFAGQTLRFAFRNNSKDMYQLWIDDIEVINASSAYDAALYQQVPKKYILVNTPDTIKATIVNAGAVTITSVNVSYQVGNSSINTENILYPGGISFRQGATIKFALPFSTTTSGYYKVKTWINTINGQADQLLSNDTTSYSITVQNSSPSKTVLLEQFTSANNGEGPDAQEKAMALQSPSVVVVDVHVADSLQDSNAAALIADYKNNLPSALFDRHFFNTLGAISFDRPAYSGKVNQRKNSITPVSVAVINKNYNATTRELSFTLKADFFGEVRGDYRLNAYLTENFVSGPVSDTTINGFNQLNNFYGTPWSPYYQTGYYSPTADTYVMNYWQYQHQNVLVHAFNGAYGTNSAIPMNGPTDGQSFQQSFTVTIPTAQSSIRKFNADNLYIVGFAAEYSSDKYERSVLNTVKEKVTANPEVVGIRENKVLAGVQVYPNPSTGLFYFKSVESVSDYEISVYDVMGKCNRIVNVKNTTEISTLDLSALPEGIYFVKISSDKGQTTEKIILQK